MSNLLDTPKHDDLIYDIGMHKGEDAEFYLRKGFRVVAIEADPELLRFCKTRLKNFLDEGRLTIVEGAISDLSKTATGPKKVRFYKNIDCSVWGTIHSNWAERNTRLGTSSSVVEVDAIALQDVMMMHGIPHYMKIDIEGADMICIDALRSFKKRPDYISIESDKTSFAKIKNEMDTFIELGYDSFQAIEQSAIDVSQAPPCPAREGKYLAHKFENGSSGLFGSELGDEWKSKQDILRQYRVIRLGYYLVGDDGVLFLRRIWPLWALAWPLRALVRRFLGTLTNSAVPGWYDTHARHSGVRPPDPGTVGERV